MAKSKEKEVTAETPAVNAVTAVDKKAFRERKLAVLNQKHGAMYERAADRVVQNNLQERVKTWLDVNQAFY